MTAMKTNTGTTTHETSDNCIFCKIVAGEIPASKVYEDNEVLAFLNIQPNASGHTLIISKDHFENIYSTPDETLCRIMIVVRKLTIAMKNGLDTDGMTNIMNSESAGHIGHVHVHIIPRYNEDGLAEWPIITYKEGEAESVLKKISAELKN
jgi:histidine triad (HIT) family protein